MTSQCQRAHRPGLDGWPARESSGGERQKSRTADVSTLLDGNLYVTTSLLSTWDNGYPEIRTKGGVMVMIDCDVENGGMAINEDFVDFGQEPNGPSHATRLATRWRLHSDIWL